MELFDEYIKQTLTLLERYNPAHHREQMNESADQHMSKIDSAIPAWGLTDRNTFLMDRDTAVELGGYPKESVNLIIPSSSLYQMTDLACGVYCIGSISFPGRWSKVSEKQNSFGKIVLLDTEEIPDEEIYAFTQSELLTDSRIHMENVMTRQSPTHYNINLRVGKKAVKDGFTLERMGLTIYESFCRMEHVRGAIVILIAGESPLYKELFGIAEKVKEITLTLNHIFDGIEMDCGHCDVRPICNEVESLRKLHRKLKNTNQA